MHRTIDICEAHTVLEWDYNQNGWLRERPSNLRRMESSAVQIHRMGIQLRRSLGGFETLTTAGQLIYVANVLKLGLPVGKSQLLEWNHRLGAGTVQSLIAAYGAPKMQVV